MYSFTVEYLADIVSELKPEPPFSYPFNVKSPELSCTTSNFIIMLFPTPKSPIILEPKRKGGSLSDFPIVSNQISV